MGSSFLLVLSVSDFSVVRGHFQPFLDVLQEIRRDITQKVCIFLKHKEPATVATVCLQIRGGNCPSNILARCDLNAQTNDIGRKKRTGGPRWCAGPLSQGRHADSRTLCVAEFISAAYLDALAVRAV
jgi:hypothetical protein